MQRKSEKKVIKMSAGLSHRRRDARRRHGRPGPTEVGVGKGWAEDAGTEPTKAERGIGKVRARDAGSGPTEVEKAVSAKAEPGTRAQGRQRSKKKDVKQD